MKDTTKAIICHFRKLDVLKFVLSAYVIYSVFMGELSFNINYSIVIATVFLTLVINIILSLDHKYKSLFNYIKWIDYVVLVFLFINSVWILFIPTLHNLSVSMAIQEAGMLLVFILYFPIAILIRMGKIDFRYYLKLFFWSTFVLACWYVVIWSAEVIKPGSLQGFFDFLAQFTIFKVGKIYKGWGIVRVVLANMVLLPVGLFLLFLKRENFKILDYICTFIFTFAILSTFTKSIWFALIAGVIVTVIYFFVTLKNGNPNFNIIKINATVLVTVIILNFTVFDGTISMRLINSFSNVYTSSQSSSSTNKSKLENNSTQTPGDKIASSSSVGKNSEASSAPSTSSKAEKDSSHAVNSSQNNASSTANSSVPNASPKAEKDNSHAVNSSQNNTSPTANNSEWYSKDKIASDSKASNSEKLKQIDKLLGKWKGSPMLGYGYGSFVENYTRSSTAKFAYEMTSFALLMKIGIIGIVAWISLFVCTAINSYKKNKKNMINFIVWLIISVGFLMSIQTNPLLFNANSLNLIMYLVLQTVEFNKSNNGNALESKSKVNI